MIIYFVSCKQYQGDSSQNLVAATDTVLQLAPATSVQQLVTGTMSTTSVQQSMPTISVQQPVPAANTVLKLSVAPVTSVQQLVPSTSATKVIEAGSSSRSWAGRRRPYLQQKPTESAKSASVAASNKITEFSAAKCELAKLQMEIEKERKQYAADEHKLLMEMMREEQKWKLEEHQLKMELIRAELNRHAAEQ